MRTLRTIIITASMLAALAAATPAQAATAPSLLGARPPALGLIIIVC